MPKVPTCSQCEHSCAYETPIVTKTKDRGSRFFRTPVRTRRDEKRVPRTGSAGRPRALSDEPECSTTPRVPPSELSTKSDQGAEFFPSVCLNTQKPAIAMDSDHPMRVCKATSYRHSNASTTTSAQIPEKRRRTCDRIGSEPHDLNLRQARVALYGPVGLRLNTHIPADGGGNGNLRAIIGRVGDAGGWEKEATRGGVQFRR